jgi:hypothetical protein
MELFHGITVELVVCVDGMRVSLLQGLPEKQSKRRTLFTMKSGDLNPGRKDGRTELDSRNLAITPPALGKLSPRHGNNERNLNLKRK